MFDFLFNYPAASFSRGSLVFAGGWPGWLLPVAVAAAVALLWIGWRRMRRVDARRRSILFAMQAASVALLLLILWQPALSVSMLRPQQNVIAVVVDDSRSMALQEDGRSRRDVIAGLLDGGLLDRMRERFQVRLYRASSGIDRIAGTAELRAEGASTRIGAALGRVADESATLPTGAVVLVSDGAENAGGIDGRVLAALRAQRIPVHTVGVGRERLISDIELLKVAAPDRTLADSRVPIYVTLRQAGFSGATARIKVSSGRAVLATRDVLLKSDDAAQTETLIVNPGSPGARTLEVAVEPVAGETNAANNALRRVVSVEDKRPRILYIEGEPRWEFKFIRRAAEADSRLELVTMVRTTQNKVYRQGIANPAELEQGFPATVEELFAYDGLIVGGVEAAWFTAAQQQLIREFAGRRGGGVLFLAGRNGLGDGGWAQSDAADLLPVTLPAGKNTFRREPANVEITAAGQDSIICRLEDQPERNAERWRKLPYLANIEDAGSPRPGAAVLLNAVSGNRKTPLLVTQHYGRGRSAVLATGGTWRWQMQLPVEDRTHEMFWQQTMRWLVSGSGQRVTAATDATVYADEAGVRLTAEVRDSNWLPAADARVEARITLPDGSAQTAPLAADPKQPGLYTLQWTAPAQGSYVAEVIAWRGEEEAGRDAVSFAREDGVAENFHLEQNRELLEGLSRETGGRYYKAGQANRLAEEIAYSEAGISSTELRDLWNMPVLFGLVLGLRGGEWALRRRWGIV